jgi:hypothetical protein
MVHHPPQVYRNVQVEIHSGVCMPFTSFPAACHAHVKIMFFPVSWPKFSFENWVCEVSLLGEILMPRNSLVKIPQSGHTSLLGASCLPRRHKQILLIAENVNKMLGVIST